jgi:hypothetical protein
MADIFEKKKTDKKSGHFRLTTAGITNETSGWWYFLRKYDDKENPYWYRKMRSYPTKSDPNGKIIEQYVGLEFPYSVPSSWITKLKKRATK